MAEISSSQRSSAEQGDEEGRGCDAAGAVRRREEQRCSPVHGRFLGINVPKAYREEMQGQTRHNDGLKGRDEYG